MLLNRYQIVSEIGKGGSAKVFKVLDQRLQKHWAIKCIYKDSDPLTLAIFQREVEVLARLNHPCIPHIVDQFMDDKFYYVVMDFIDGVSLDHFCDEKRILNRRTWKNIMFQACNIIIYLHSLRPELVLNDLKPQNLILSKDKKLYMIDFGASCFIDLHAPLAATPQFAHQDLLRNAKVQLQNDMYSFGRTFFFLYYHKFPQKKHYFRNSERVLLSCCQKKIPFKSFLKIKRALFWSFPGYRKMAYAFICTLVFVFLGNFFKSNYENKIETSYQKYMQNRDFENAIQLAPYKVEAYEQFNMQLKKRKKFNDQQRLWFLDQMIRRRNQTKNRAIANFYVLECMELMNENSLRRATHYFPYCKGSDSVNNNILAGYAFISRGFQKREKIQNDDVKVATRRISSMLKNIRKLADPVIKKRHLHIILVFMETFKEIFYKDQVLLGQLRKEVLEISRFKKMNLDKEICNIYYHFGLYAFENKQYNLMNFYFKEAVKSEYQKLSQSKKIARMMFMIYERKNETWKKVNGITYLKKALTILENNENDAEKIVLKTTIEMRIQLDLVEYE